MWNWNKNSLRSSYCADGLYCVCFAGHGNSFKIDYERYYVRFDVIAF